MAELRKPSEDRTGRRSHATARNRRHCIDQRNCDRPLRFPITKPNPQLGYNGWYAVYPTSITDDQGVSVIQLRSSGTIGGATVTAVADGPGGSGSVYVPFVDKWVAAASVYSTWTAYGAAYGCSAWSPDPSTVTAGSTFTQSQTCTQAYQHYRQDREQSAVTGQYRNVGTPVALYTTQQANYTRQATGTKQNLGACLEYVEGVPLGRKGTVYNGWYPYYGVTGTETPWGQFYFRCVNIDAIAWPDFWNDYNLNQMISNGDTAGVNAWIDARRTNQNYWFKGSDGNGIYALWKSVLVPVEEGATRYQMPYTGLCVIQEPTNLHYQGR